MHRQGPVERRHAQAALGLRRGEDPDRAAGQAVEDFARGGRKPDRARADLAVAQEQLALTVVAPLQGDDLALSASRDQQQANDRHELRTIGLMARQHFAQPAELRRRQEALPPLSPVPLDARARIGSLGPIAVDLGLSHDDREDGSGAVGGHRGLVKGGEPVPDIAHGDGGDRMPLKPGQDLIAVVPSVHKERGRLPVPSIAAEHFFGDGLERDIRRRCGLRVTAVADRGHQGLRPVAGLVYADGAGIADDLPEPPSLVLAVDEVASGAGGHDPHAEALEVSVAHVVG